MINEDTIIENLINRLLTKDFMGDVPYGYENRINNFADSVPLKVIFSRRISYQTDEANTVWKSIFYLSVDVDVKIGTGTKAQNDLIVAIRGVFDPQNATDNLNLTIDGYDVNVNTAIVYEEGTTEDGYYRRSLQLKITATK